MIFICIQLSYVFIAQNCFNCSFISVYPVFFFVLATNGRRQNLMIMIMMKIMVLLQQKNKKTQGN